MTSIECPICFDEFNEETIMMCSGGHPHACAYCLSKILSNNCSICRKEVFHSNEDVEDSSDNEDSDDVSYYDSESEDDLADSDYVYGITTSIIKILEMAGGGPNWWYYEIHFNGEGEQEKVYIVNQSGKSFQRRKRLFFYEEDCDRVILKNEDFEDPDWIMLVHYVE